MTVYYLRSGGLGLGWDGGLWVPVQSPPSADDLRRLWLFKDRTVAEAQSDSLRRWGTKKDDRLTTTESIEVTDPLIPTSY